MRITHESLLRLIAGSMSSSTAPGFRYLHSSGWSLRPAPGGPDRPNWCLVWHEEGDAPYRSDIEKSAQSLGALYDVIW